MLQGYNATVFAYGSTGAGKTFTMIGTPVEPGIMFRSVEEIFKGVATVVDEGTESFSISCSFVEVYNENFRDLAGNSDREGILDLREDPVSGSYVAGIREIQTESVQEVMDLLQHGNQRRTTEPTAMNVTSSRSHAVLQVRVERKGNPSNPSGSLLGKLSMIDLAGSERAAETKNQGVRLLEGANINRSLLALGNCINALASGSHFVPYRDSKLTRLLKEFLGRQLQNGDDCNNITQSFELRRYLEYAEICQPCQEHPGSRQTKFGDSRRARQPVRARHR